MNTPQSVTGPINLGNPHEVTIAEIAQKIVSLTGSSSKIIFHPLPENDPKRRQPDISRAVETLQWRPRTDLDSGLLLTVRYFAQQLGCQPHAGLAQHLSTFTDTGQNVAQWIEPVVESHE
jgi:UDP-glucuronate decarboxylase